MIKWENPTENYNPHILFVIHSHIDGSKYIPKLKYHCHDFIELLIVISGSVNYIIDDNYHNLRRGQVLILDPGVYHNLLLDERTKVSILLIGITNVNFIEDGENFIELKYNSSILTLNTYEEDFLKCCDELVKEQKNKKFAYSLLLKSLVMKLLAIIFREIELNDTYLYTVNCSNESREKRNIVNTIIDYLEANYMKEVSLDKLSKNMYLSSVYISKIFKEETGDSPINHLIKIRLSKAKQLLTESNLPIKVVAQTVGYNDAYYFSKLFKKYYGVPPSKIK